MRKGNVKFRPVQLDKDKGMDEWPKRSLDSAIEMLQRHCGLNSIERLEDGGRILEDGYKGFARGIERKPFSPGRQLGGASRPSRGIALSHTSPSHSPF